MRFSRDSPQRFGFQYLHDCSRYPRFHARSGDGQNTNHLTDYRLYMEPRNARQILHSLAQGRDPFSGTTMAGDALYRQQQATGALLTAVAALKMSDARKRRRGRRPRNVGRTWTDSEERELVLAFRTGEQLEEIATRHGRSLRAIEVRLEKLDLISAQRRSSRHRCGPTTHPEADRLESAISIPGGS